MEKVHRGGVAFIIAGVIAATGACDRTATPNEITEVRSAVSAAAKTPEQALVAAKQARDNGRQKYMSLKSSLDGRLVGDPQRGALEAQLHDALAAGAQYPVAPTAGAKAPGADPDLAAKMEALRAKMANYDMNKPDDVSALAALKAQELGR